VWTLLTSPEDWAAYEKSLAVRLEVPENAVVCGNPPKSYPALADSAPMPRRAGEPLKMMTAFVYLPDAERLIAAAPKKRESELQQGGPTQAQYNRWNTALLMTVIGLMTDTIKLASKAVFEERLLDALETVDEYTNAQRSGHKPRRVLTDANGIVLPRLLDS